MKKWLILLSALSLFSHLELFSQSYNPQIDAQEMEKHIRFLASDDLKGRKPGTTGGKEAATFIRSKFKQAGVSLLGDRGFQYFEVTTGIKFGKQNSLSSGDSIYQIDETFIPLSFSGNGSLKSGLVFAGYGFSIQSDTLTWDDYAGIDARGKWVMIFRADPDLDNLVSPYAQYSTDRYKVMNAMDHGAAGVILVSRSNLMRRIIWTF